VLARRLGGSTALSQRNDSVRFFKWQISFPFRRFPDFFHQSPWNAEAIFPLRPARVTPVRAGVTPRPCAVTAPADEVTELREKVTAPACEVPHQPGKVTPLLCEVTAPPEEVAALPSEVPPLPLKVPRLPSEVTDEPEPALAGQKPHFFSDPRSFPLQN
jgi:hypothetical protein